MTGRIIFFLIAAGVGAYIATKIVTSNVTQQLKPQGGSGMNGLY